MRNEVVVEITAVICPEKQVAFTRQLTPIFQILIIRTVEFVFQIGYKARADGRIIKGDIFGQFHFLIERRRGVKRIHVRVNSKTDPAPYSLFFNPFFQHRRKAFRRFND